jgi:hypothetical protein
MPDGDLCSAIVRPPASEIGTAEAPALEAPGQLLIFHSPLGVRHQVKR